VKRLITESSGEREQPDWRKLRRTTFANGPATSIASSMIGLLEAVMAWSLSQNQSSPQSAI
jgi:hypothetical protein